MPAGAKRVRLASVLYALQLSTLSLINITSGSQHFAQIDVGMFFHNKYWQVVNEIFCDTALGGQFSLQKFLLAFRM